MASLLDAYIHSRLERTWRIGVVSPSQVKRSLFGPVDHDANRKFIEEEIEKLQGEDNKKWNFDFIKEAPLAVNGNKNYEWIPVRTRDATDPPEMREAEDRNDDKNGGDHDIELSSSQEISTNDVDRKLPMRQTQITDFMRKRKSSFPGVKNEITSSTQPSSKISRRSSA